MTSSPFGTGTFGAMLLGGGGAPTSSGITAWGGAVTLYVEVDLSQAVDDPGLNVSSSSANWDAATWDGVFWPSGTTWTDVTADCRSVTTSRAFSRQGNAYTAGSATVVLGNLSGDYSPGNTASPYRLGTSTTIGIWRPFRIRATYDNGATVQEWPIFTGLTKSWEETFPESAHDSIVTIQATDGFTVLGAFNGYEQSPVGAGELTGARIARLLTNAEYAYGSVLDAGSTTCQATTLAQNCLSEIKLTADSEGGWVWCGPDNRIMFDQYDAPITKARSNSVQIPFADDGTPGALQFEDASFSYNGDLVVNRAAYARVGSTAQVYSSQDSRILYGLRQQSRTDLICETDAQALSVAERAIAANSRPERRVESLKFKPQGQQSEAGIALAWDALSRQLIELRSLTQVTVTPPHGDELVRSVFITGLNHTITPDTWSVGLQFESATVYQGLVNSRWDTAVWDSPNWSF